MPDNDPDLLGINRGSVVAPAGCGKTELIVRALTRHSGPKPILVLTHTNAGVAALRGRLKRSGVATSAYRLATIDAWAIRTIQAFPTRSGHDPAILEGERPDYQAIRNFALNLLQQQHIDDIIDASYDRLLVDEYQDCLTIQHKLVSELARTLPCCVMGDPVQAIFGFGQNRLVEWDNHVIPTFPAAAELNQPWRWINAGAQELGQWLLDTRTRFLKGQAIDLGESPNAVSWIELHGTPRDRDKHLKACRTRPPNAQGTVLVIADSTNPDAQRRFASQTPGAVAIESVDLRDFVAFAQDFDIEAEDALSAAATFAQSMMTGIGATDLVRRVGVLRRGRNRRDASQLERQAMAFEDQRTFNSLAVLFSSMSEAGGVRTYRPTVLSACLRAINRCEADATLSFAEAATFEREQYRHAGREIPKRAVGSTLLLKGLESDVVVIHDAHRLNARNLYVALTRGARRTVICSRYSSWTPTW